MVKPVILFRLSKAGEHLFLRVPDDDSEQDAVLTFNRVMADLGYPDPSVIFNKRLGVAVVRPIRRIVVNETLESVDMLVELSKYFRLRKINDAVWHTKRF
ncbi:unnamed protein product [marine sediment metagenome]|uniref:Uncharacterized protein n=1 Tax=marine sediment metagenome TaxID=412755 RepID=X1GJD2_9ZZZZ